MGYASIFRIGLLTALAGVAIAFALTWALHAHAPAPHTTLTVAQEKAYEEGFNLCRSRFIDGASPQGDDQWNAVLHQFEVCTAQLGTPFKTTWEPQMALRNRLPRSSASLVSDACTAKASGKESGMQAAVVSDPSKPPAYAAFADPAPSADEVLVTVTRAAQSTLAKAQAAGKHYSSSTKLPFIPGVDGVGRLEDGTRVYFAFPRPPYGSMATKVAVPRDFCIALPDDLSDDVAAASGNPGMSSWAALTERARLQTGETVLLNGATGVSGRLALQIAKHLGAGRVIATGRNAAALNELRTLGADTTISLDASYEELVAVLRAEIRASNVNVILDYLWGKPASALIEALSGSGSAEAEPRVRFVQIGSSAGPEIALNAKHLRSSGLELIGSGLGSISHKKLVAATGAFLQNVIPSGFRIETRLAPLADVATMWDQPREDRSRLVFTV